MNPVIWQRKRRQQLQEFYKVDDLDGLFVDFYTNKQMSTFEISEKLFNDTGINFNARSIQRIVGKKVKTRDRKTSFQLAILKGRVRWMLTEYKDKVRRKNIPYSVRFAVLSAAGYKCEACGNPDRLTVDHRISLSHGGTNDISNLQALCWPCNSGKNVFLKETKQSGRLESLV